MKQSEMHKKLIVAFSAWPTFEVTIEQSAVWAYAFKDSSEADFSKALMATLKTHTGNFPPTIGQVNENLQAIRCTSSAGDGWGLLCAAIARYGSYRESEALNFLSAKDKKAAKAVLNLGWKNICSWQTKDEPINRAHFLRLYESETETERRYEALGLPVNFVKQLVQKVITEHD